MFALAFDVAGGWGDLPVVFSAAEHMVALLNRLQRFDEAMRGAQRRKRRGSGGGRRDTGLGFWQGGGQKVEMDGGNELSSSINFQMSVAKNSLPPPPSSSTNNRRAALCAHRRCHAEICAPADIRECTLRGRAPPVALGELRQAAGDHVARLL